MLTKTSTKGTKDIAAGETLITEDRKKRIYVPGDSIVKHIKWYEISNQIENCQVFVGGFPGTTTRCMQDYVQPKTRANPNHIVIHIGKNGFCSSKQPEEIAERIITLASSLKTIHVTFVLNTQQKMEVNCTEKNY